MSILYAFLLFILFEENCTEECVTTIFFLLLKKILGIHFSGYSLNHDCKNVFHYELHKPNNKSEIIKKPTT